MGIRRERRGTPCFLIEARLGGLVKAGTLGGGEGRAPCALGWRSSPLLPLTPILAAPLPPPAVYSSKKEEGKITAYRFHALCVTRRKARPLGPDPTHIIHPSWSWILGHSCPPARPATAAPVSAS